MSPTRRRRTALLHALLAVYVAMAVGGVVLVVVDSPAKDERSCDGATAKGRVGASDGDDVLNLSAEDLGRTLSAAHDAGVWSVRVDVDWSRVEAERGRRDWSDVDRVVRAVTAHGMCAHGLITYAPAWAGDPTDHPEGSAFPPSDPNLFGQFAREAAQRYRHDVAVWEVWNEPNTVRFFKPAPNAGRYAALLASAYTAIKSVDAEMTVLSGGLAPAEDNGRDIAPTTFLAGLYAADANRYFDGFAIHPYSYPALPNDPATAEWNTALRMATMHDIMVAGGDAQKPVWITECGAPTGTARVAVTDAVQAETIRIVLRAARDVAWLGPAFVYSIRDSGTDTDDAEENFGVLRHDFSPKPAYAVVREFGMPAS
jgi:hypothetical protein